MRYLAVTSLIIMMLISLVSAKSVELTSAQIYFSQGDYHKALEFYKIAITDLEKEVANAKAEGKRDKKAEKNLAQAYFETGQCYQKLYDYQLMSEYFDKSMELSNKFVNEILDTREDLWIKFFNDGVPLFNDGDYKGAFEKFNTAVIIDPYNEAGLKQRALCYVRLNDYENAVKDLENYLVLEKEYELEKDISVRVTLANIYFMNQRNDDALKMYEEALELDPENVAVITKLGTIYQQNDEIDKAMKMYDSALQKNPGNSDLWFNMGILYFNLENFDKAIESFNKVIELNPGDIESMMNLVNSLWKEELYAQAIPYLEQVLQLDPENVDAWSFLNVAYVKESQNEDLDEATRKEYIEKAQKAFDKYKEFSGK